MSGRLILAHEEVLAELAAGGPASAGELAEELVTSTSTIRARLADLVSRGWVYAKPRTGGGGSVYQVTERGREADVNNESF